MHSGYDASQLVYYNSIEQFNITGTAFSDELSGEIGDTLNGGGGDDILNLNLGSTTAAVTVDLSQANNFSNTTTQITNFERVGGLSTGSGNDTIKLGVNASSSGLGYIYGNGGTDKLILDYSTYNYADSGIYNTGDRVHSGYDASQLVYYNSIEQFNITGTAFSDELSGLGGNDTLNGGGGDDTLAGSTGNDTYIVDSLDDTIIENVGEGTDTVNTALDGYTLSDNVENLTLTSGSITGTGNALNNVLIGSTGNNILSGLAGNDNLQGGAGNDLLDGDAGNDTLDGGTGNDAMLGGIGNDTYTVDSLTDSITENAGEGTDTVKTILNAYTLNSNLENLILIDGNISGTGNAVNNVLTGSIGNNTLNGLAGNDTITGLGGDDILVGGAGNDLLTGGLNNDKFLYDTGAAFNSANVGIDKITDLATGLDKIVLDKTTFTALLSVAGNGFSNASDFATVTSDAAVGASSAFIVYNTTNGNLFYNQDGTTTNTLGTGAQFATLTNLVGLSATDFIVQA